MTMLAQGGVRRSARQSEVEMAGWLASDDLTDHTQTEHKEEEKVLRKRVAMFVVLVS